MPTHPYFAGTNHGQRVAAALDEFHRALTRRWREEVCRALVNGYEFPRSIGHAPPAAPAWDYATVPAHRHLAAGNCAYVAWVESGQRDPLSAVNCVGWTGPDPIGTTWTDPATGVEDLVPPYIECGMGAVLAQVEDWAWLERQHVFHQVPLFDTHDLGALQAAHDAFLQVGASLGLDAAADSDDSVQGMFAPVSNRQLPLIVDGVSSHNQDNQLWYDHWTGLAASSARHGFFASVEPTLCNQSSILGALANLYSQRATIIEKARNDTLYWIQWATKSLDETAPVDLTDGWVAVQGIGTGVSVAFGWSGLGSVVGSAITLFGFIGQYALPKVSEAYVHDLATLVGQLNDKIGNLSREVGGLEIGYSLDINRLCEGIHGIHSFNLELYDLTRNDAEKDRPASGTGGVTMDVGEVLRLAEGCYTAGELYADLVKIVTDTRAADAHLADKEGHPTRADRRLLELRDQVEEYLRTSAGRYLVAADQVKKAVKLFVEVDTAQQRAFEDITADWETKEVGEFDPGFDPLAYAAATDRPLTWAPDHEWGRATPPGAEDPGRSDYVTD